MQPDVRGEMGQDLSVSGAVEIWRGGVNTWECDQMGHLNVRFYVARAQEGLAALALRLGKPQAFAAHANATLQVREHHIRFLREARAGDPLHMVGGVVEMTETEAVLLQVMLHASGEPCAAFLTRVVHTPPLDGRGFAWPERSRAAAGALAVEVPDFARPRGVTAAPPPPGEATLARAEALGLRCIARGAVTGEECDVFGRLAPERIIGRIAEGIGGLMGALREGQQRAVEGSRLGGAALEYRIVYGERARAGDHVEVRSGLIAAEAKVQRIGHWVLDPVSGRPWATAQAVVASLDLETRRLAPFPAEVLAAYQAQAIPGFIA